MYFPNPFTRPGNWYKGCLHIHSTASDGLLTPEEIYAWYRDRGYHFVALADHGVLSEALGLQNDFITLSGIEVEGIDPQSGAYHAVGLGLSLPHLDASRDRTLQDAIESLRAAGGIVCLAHPYWTGQMSKDLLELEGCFALEIYNGGCEVDDAKGFSIVHWDDLLAAGRKLWGLAVDDAHWWHGDRDAGLGWVWVKARELTQTAILQGLEQGYFYASSGPQIHDLQLDVNRSEIRVHCSPSVAINFVGNAWLSRRVTAPLGQPLTEASYRWQNEQQYLRVACQDRQGRWAWSNPIFLT